MTFLLEDFVISVHSIRVKVCFIRVSECSSEDPHISIFHQLCCFSLYIKHHSIKFLVTVLNTKLFGVRIIMDNEGTEPVFTVYIWWIFGKVCRILWNLLSTFY